MKYLFFVFVVLSFMSALLGFAVLGGPAATVFKFLFFALFILAMIAMFRRPKAVKPVASTFASSFASESAPATFPITPAVSVTDQPQ